MNEGLNWWINLNKLISRWRNEWQRDKLINGLMHEYSLFSLLWIECFNDVWIN